MPSRSNVRLMSSGTSSQLRFVRCPGRDNNGSYQNRWPRDPCSPSAWGAVSPECLQSAQTKIAHPIRVLFHIRDVMDSALAQAGARVAHVSFRVREIALTAINIDGCRFGFHLLLPCKRRFGSSLACPIVTSFLELQSEFFSPAPNDSPSYHHMDVVGNDVVQEPLIVRD